ncbi:hypothetical protein Avi_1146 [Allorhizobium ampelinum S4]|uniref:Uncharacterized protein n=1 Tax=Allorhizobium ampelinum (strain ATCC BAA-846 / DSM 112012 / S4) TaxID=311402 RepID=B9JTA3_ALLAM|nr:hypothetical protein [Agrobacterium vitis]ACM35816.1 hypothetical protein Avi_1146 [Allorhizobium ampelinum S4]MVA71451.1 hypothetical protein [Agrobacterium vitis]
MGDQQTRETRSPPDDKKHSLERDCRDCYGENNKSKRKAIPLFKARSNRRGRHAAKVAIVSLLDDDSVDEMNKLAIAEHFALHPQKRKSSDRPLLEFFNHQRVRQSWRSTRNKD